MSSKTQNMHEGMTNKSPAAPSAKPKGGSVADGATRDTVSTVKSLGGRTA